VKYVSPSWYSCSQDLVTSRTGKDALQVERLTGVPASLHRHFGIRPRKAHQRRGWKGNCIELVLLNWLSVRNLRHLWDGTNNGSMQPFVDHEGEMAVRAMMVDEPHRCAWLLILATSLGRWKYWGLQDQAR
jgi:hypothetical protein